MEDTVNQFYIHDRFAISEFKLIIVLVLEDNILDCGDSIKSS